MRSKLKLIAGLLVFIFSLPVAAQVLDNAAPPAAAGASAPASEAPPTARNIELPLVKFLRNQGMQIQNGAFINGAQSWVAEKDGQKALLLALPNTENILLGNVFDPQGNNVTNNYLKDSTTETVVEKTNVKKAAPPAFKTLAALHTIDIGQDGKPVYLFLDPLCGPCRQVYQQITAQQAAKPNQVQLHVVPVGILSKDSHNVAAGLWSQADHVKALQEMVQLAADKNKTAELDHLHAGWLLQTTETARQAIAQNNQFLQARKLNSVPVLFWADAQNNPKIIKGTPNNLNTVLENLFNGSATP